MAVNKENIGVVVEEVGYHLLPIFKCENVTFQR